MSREQRSLEQFQRIAAYLKERQARGERKKRHDIDLAWLAYRPPLSSRSNARQLRRIFIRERGVCFYCGKATWLKSAGNGHTRDMATREHLIRRCDGGPDTDENIVLACHDCNTTRGDLSVEDHKAAIRMRKVDAE